MKQTDKPQFTTYRQIYPNEYSMLKNHAPTELKKTDPCWLLYFTQNVCLLNSLLFSNVFCDTALVLNMSLKFQRNMEAKKISLIQISRVTQHNSILRQYGLHFKPNVPHLTGTTSKTLHVLCMGHSKYTLIIR